MASAETEKLSPNKLESDKKNIKNVLDTITMGQFGFLWLGAIGENALPLAAVISENNLIINDRPDLAVRAKEVTDRLEEQNPVSQIDGVYSLHKEGTPDVCVAVVRLHHGETNLITFLETEKTQK